MVATYPAQLPSKSSFELRENPHYGPGLLCRLSSSTRDVFETYYEARNFYVPRKSGGSKRKTRTKTRTATPSTIR